MVSLDEVDKNRQFAESLDAEALTLLSDEEGEVASAYGVKGFLPFAKRWTFYIDEKGVIRHIDKDVDTETAGQDIARKLAELGFPRSGGTSSSAKERGPGPEEKAAD